ncbi:MAG: hypothetical protein JHC93_01805, partial [Parachlamydiales bacterium]|nr:hypothetical protein [Parachlamydiales bacterium]
MTSETIPFSKMVYERPVVKDYQTLCNGFIDKLKGSNEQDLLYILKCWDHARERIQTLQNIITIKYTSNTQDPLIKEEKNFFDKSMPHFEELDIEVIKAILKNTHN